VPQTLNDWIPQQEVDAGVSDGFSSDERARINELEREVKELRKTNEILKLASAFLALAEHDRR
jgi:transposase